MWFELFPGWLAFALVFGKSWVLASPEYMGLVVVVRGVRPGGGPESWFAMTMNPAATAQVG